MKQVVTLPRIGSVFWQPWAADAVLQTLGQRRAGVSGPPSGPAGSTRHGRDGCNHCYQRNLAQAVFDAAAVY